MLTIKTNALGGTKAILEATSFSAFIDKELEDFLLLIINKASEDVKNDKFSKFYFVVGNEELSILTNYHYGVDGTTVDVAYLKDDGYGIDNDLLSSNIAYLNVVDLFRLICTIISTNSFDKPFVNIMNKYL